MKLEENAAEECE